MTSLLKTVKRHLQPVTYLILFNSISLTLSFAVFYLFSSVLKSGHTEAGTGISMIEYATVFAAIIAVNGLSTYLMAVRTGVFKPDTEVPVQGARSDTTYRHRGIVTLKRGPENTERTRQLRLLKLNRSAERLNKVEHELIRGIARTQLTDRKLEKLMCEMQICTNRVMAQISEVREMSIRDRRETVV